MENNSLNLNQQDLEMALKIVDQAWSEAEGVFVQMEIPPSLDHLTKNQWEQVCLFLDHLQWMQDRSPVH